MFNSALKKELTFLRSRLKPNYVYFSPVKFWVFEAQTAFSKFSGAAALDERNCISITFSALQNRRCN